VPQTSTTSRIASATSPRRETRRRKARRPRPPSRQRVRRARPLALATRRVRPGDEPQSERRAEPVSAARRRAPASRSPQRCERVRSAGDRAEHRDPAPRAVAGSTTPIQQRRFGGARRGSKRRPLHATGWHTTGRGSGPVSREVADALGRLKLRPGVWSAAISSSTIESRVDARDDGPGLRPARPRVDPGEGQRELVARKVMLAKFAYPPRCPPGRYGCSACVRRAPARDVLLVFVVHAGILEAAGALRVRQVLRCSGDRRHGRRRYGRLSRDAPRVVVSGFLSRDRDRHSGRPRHGPGTNGARWFDRARALRLDDHRVRRRVIVEQIARSSDRRLGRTPKGANDRTPARPLHHLRYGRVGRAWPRSFAPRGPVRRGRFQGGGGRRREGARRPRDRRRRDRGRRPETCRHRPGCGRRRRVGQRRRQSLHLLVARNVRRDIQIVARASDEDAEKKLLLAGADRVVCVHRRGERWRTSC